MIWQDWFGVVVNGEWQVNKGPSRSTRDSLSFGRSNDEKKESQKEGKQDI